MTSPMNLIKLYESILGCAGMATDADGFVSAIGPGGKLSPALMDGKRIVLPTKLQLTSQDMQNRVRFHPLSENTLRGESDVIIKLRQLMNIRLNYTLAALGNNLLNIIGSVAEHHKLTPDQHELLSAVKDVDQKTLDAFADIIVGAIKDKPDRFLVNIFLKRRSIIKAKTWGRGGIVTFPLYEELKGENEKVGGVKLRAKDRTALIQLYDYMLPGIDQAEEYNRGSDSDVAPYLDALMKTVLGVASRINDILVLFGDKIDLGDELLFNADWVETFDNLGTMRQQIRDIPMQAGNEGSVKPGEGDTSLSGAPAPAPVSSPFMYTTPPQTFQAPAVYPWQAPSMGNPATQPPAVVETSRGANFDSYMRNNPHIAAAAASPNMFNRPQPHPWQTQQMQMQQRQPTWAQPGPGAVGNQFPPQVPQANWNGGNNGGGWGNNRA